MDKALPDITLSKQSITLDSDSLTDTFTITTNSTGNLSVVSSDDSIATVSLSDNTVTIEGLTNGDTTIIVSITEDGNYLNNSITLSVTCNLTQSLADCTPEQIQSIVSEGKAAANWSTGDTIDITLISGTVGNVTLSGTYKFVILGIDHNNSKELPDDKSHSIHLGLSKNTSGTEIAFTDWTGSTTNGSESPFNSSYFAHMSWRTNAGGWANSNMRRNICVNFLNCLPSAWQNVITAIPKYTDNTGNRSSSAATATTDKIWIMAEWEVFGSRGWAFNKEKDSQEQYAYYKNGNSTLRYGHQQTDTAVTWWQRSVDATRTDCFCCAGNDGASTFGLASWRFGFVPCFAICG